MAELIKLEEQAQHYCLLTSEILKLSSQILNAQEWITKVEESHEQELSLKDLDKLVKQGKSLPVNFEQVSQRLNKRYKDALSLQQRIQATFKTNKTRQTGGDKKDKSKG